MMPLASGQRFRFERYVMVTDSGPALAACSSGGRAWGVLSLTPRWMTSSVLSRKSMKLHRGLTRNPYISSRPGTRATPAAGRLDQAADDHHELVVGIFVAEVVATVASPGQVADPLEPRLAELAGDVLFELVEDDALHRAGSYSRESEIAP